MENIKMVPAVEKALQILNLLSESSTPSMGITAIANELSLNKGTVHSILNTLLQYNIIEKNSSTSKYSIGSGVLSLANAFEKNGDTVEHFMNIAKLMRLTCPENINYSVLKGFRNLVLASLPAEDYTLRVDVPAGTAMPSFCSSAGKVLICQFDDKILGNIFDEQYKSYTKNTISNKEEFIREIQTVRENGYAINNSEYEDGICSIGAPIKNSNGKIVAAINIVLPEARLDDSTREALIRLVIHGANELSKQH